MVRVTGLLVLLFLVWGAGGSEPTGVSCTGNQCLTAFHEPSDFGGAQSRCAQLHGQLVTVHSSAAHHALLLLLRNRTGRFWIGLHRPTGCSDPDADLRGFQWVNGNRDTEHRDWAPTFDLSCAAPRCVTVSNVNKLQWVQDECDERVPGFVCEHNFQDACAGLPMGVGESVSYVTPFGFEADDVTSLPPGTVALRLPGESKYVCFTQQWVRAPWTCEIQEGGCEHACTTDSEHGPVCYCPPGHTVNPENHVTCEVQTDDPCLALGCAHACYDDGQSHVCTCEPGYVLAQDGRHCEDFDECMDERQCSGDNDRCENLPGGFQCVCQDGYRQDGNGWCVDINECVSGPCEHLCDNSPGGYQCSCYDGYRTDPHAPHKCQLFCGAEVCDAECDPNDPLQCYCPDGYVSEERADRTVCWDIDECESNFCAHDCENTYGGYVCSCRPGHALVDGWECVKKDAGWEGSGATPTVPPMATPTVVPTRKPSGAVSAGALAGIIVCTVVLTVGGVFLIHHMLTGKMRSARKAAEGHVHASDVHVLHHEATDAC